MKKKKLTTKEVFGFTSLFLFIFTIFWGSLDLLFYCLFLILLLLNKRLLNK